MIPATVIKLLPRLASPFDGELVATRDAIARTLQTAGLDWHDLAAACMPSAQRTASSAAPAQAHRRPLSFGDLARACRDLDRGKLTPRERAFVADMVRRGFAFQPSSRQADWLASIFDRLSERAAA